MERYPDGARLEGRPGGVDRAALHAAERAGMVCVETANALDDAVTLAPGASHAMTAMLEVVAG